MRGGGATGMSVRSIVVSVGVGELSELLDRGSVKGASSEEQGDSGFGGSSCPFEETLLAVTGVCVMCELSRLVLTGGATKLACSLCTSGTPGAKDRLLADAEGTAKLSRLDAFSWI